MELCSSIRFVFFCVRVCVCVCWAVGHVGLRGDGDGDCGITAQSHAAEVWKSLKDDFHLVWVNEPGCGNPDTQWD